MDGQRCRPNAETLLWASHKSNSMKANNTQTVPLTGEQQHAINTLCANLIDAEEHARTAADNIVPEVANVKTRPALTLQSFLAEGNKNPLDLVDEARRLLIAMQKANDRFHLERFCLGWIHFICVGAIPILQKKHALSGTLKKQNAATKFKQAFDILAEYFMADSATDTKGLNTAVNKLASKIEPDEFRLATLKAFELDAEATEKLNGESADLQSRQNTPELTDGLIPNTSKHDAREYCARIVLEAWNSGKHGGKRKSTDYVFIQAKSGANLFDEIRRARNLKNKWGLATGGIMQRAAELHAMQSGGKHKKRDGLERPETMRQAAKKSREKERKDMDAERKRRSGRKR